MARLFVLLVAAWASVAIAADDEFSAAKIVDVQARQGLLPGTAAAETYTEVTLEVGDKKVTARTFPIGGGRLYLAKHPEAAMVGATVQALIARRGELHIKAADGQLLRLKIQRLEQL